YNHLQLERKIEYLNKISGCRKISVCEDVDSHFQYWKKNVNYSPNDCCNLRI
ncbi:radical SAM protein, partial [Bacteroides thetaiotaomicron]